MRLYAAAIFGALFTTSVSAATVDFETSTPGDKGASYTENGFTFNGVDGATVSIVDFGPMDRANQTAFIRASGSQGPVDIIEVIFPHATDSLALSLVGDFFAKLPVDFLFKKNGGSDDFRQVTSFGISGTGKSETSFTGLNGATSMIVSYNFSDGEQRSIGLDDLQIKSIDTAAPVPLPAGLPLLAGGLGAVAFLRSRRRSS